MGGSLSRDGVWIMSCMGYSAGLSRLSSSNGLNKKRMKWEKAVNKIVIECWIRSEPTKRKYRQ